MIKLEVKIIEQLAELKAFENHWLKLQQQLAANSFALTWPWVSAWLDQYWRTQDKLFVVCCYQQQKLVALLPLYLKKIWGGYQLRFVATGEWQQAEVVSEFQDFMLHAEHQAQVYVQLNELLNQHPEIIEIQFDHLLSNAYAGQWLEQLAWPNQSKRPLGYRYCLPIPEQAINKLALSDWLPGKTLRRQINKFLQCDNVSIEVVTEQQALLSMLPELIELHQQSWQQREQAGAFAEPQFIAFHQQLIAEFGKNQQAFMLRLLIAGQLQAICYGFLIGNTCYYYQSGVHRTSLLPSAGAAMHYCVLQWAQQQGCQFYDLMTGSTQSYKRHWYQATQQVVQLKAQKRRAQIIELVQRVVNKISKKLPA